MERQYFADETTMTLNTDTNVFSVKADVIDELLPPHTEEDAGKALTIDPDDTTKYKWAESGKIDDVIFDSQTTVDPATKTATIPFKEVTTEQYEQEKKDNPDFNKTYYAINDDEKAFDFVQDVKLDNVSVVDTADNTAYLYNNQYYAVCNTPDNQLNKEITIPNFTFRNGVIINVKFTYGFLDDLLPITLNINNHEAVPIIIGTDSSLNGQYRVIDGQTLNLVYNEALNQFSVTGMVAVATERQYGLSKVDTLYLNGGPVSNPHIYSPEGCGTEGQFLMSNGPDGVPTWENLKGVYKVEVTDNQGVPEANKTFEEIELAVGGGSICLMYYNSSIYVVNAMTNNSLTAVCSYVEEDGHINVKYLIMQSNSTMSYDEQLTVKYRSLF